MHSDLRLYASLSPEDPPTLAGFWRWQAFRMRLAYKEPEPWAERLAMILAALQQGDYLAGFPNWSYYRRFHITENPRRGIWLACLDCDHILATHAQCRNDAAAAWQRHLETRLLAYTQGMQEAARA
jgi:hypothetical protein